MLAWAWLLGPWGSETESQDQQISQVGLEKASVAQPICNNSQGETNQLNMDPIAWSLPSM